MNFVKNLWKIVKDACREPPEFHKHFDDHEFCLWAFGVEYRSMSLHGKLQEWNNLHDDILHLSCDSKIFDDIDSMYKLYLDHLTPDKEIKNDSA